MGTIFALGLAHLSRVHGQIGQIPLEDSIGGIERFGRLGWQRHGRMVELSFIFILQLYLRSTVPRYFGRVGTE